MGLEREPSRRRGKYYLETFEMRLWRKRETINWTEKIRNDDVLKKNRRGKNSHEDA